MFHFHVCEPPPPSPNRNLERAMSDNPFFPLTYDPEIPIDEKRLGTPLSEEEKYAGRKYTFHLSFSLNSSFFSYQKISLHISKLLFKTLGCFFIIIICFLFIIYFYYNLISFVTKFVNISFQNVSYFSSALVLFCRYLIYVHIEKNKCFIPCP